MKESSFLSDIRKSAHGFLHPKQDVPDVVLVPETVAKTSLAEQLLAIDLSKPAAALKIIDQVLDAVRSQATSHTLTTQEVDLAMEQVEALAKQAAKTAKKEDREADRVEDELSWTDKVRAFFRGSNDRIALARKERKEADRAVKAETKTKQTGSLLDEAVDQLIIQEVSEAEPEFAKLLNIQDKLADLITAGEAVVEAASAVQTAAIIDATANVHFPADGKNTAAMNVLNSAVEASQDMQVAAANAQLETTLNRLQKLLEKYQKWVEDLDWSPNFLLQFNNMTDVTWHMVGNEAMTTMGHMLDTVGGLLAMSEASDLEGTVQSLVDELQAEFVSTETAITRVIEAVRADLKLG